MSTPESETPWYQDGLAFSCTRCGACCTGAPGYVWVTPEEIERLADYRGLSVSEFAARFVRRVGHRHSLIERPGGDCIFWDKTAGCTVYPARPVQCQTWPFWPENVESQQEWDRVRSVCPGSGKGRLYTVDEIVASISRHKDD
jgi:Fe-S-cluster containining protein